MTNRATTSNVPSTPEIFTPPASPAMITETIEKDNSATNPTSFTTTPTSFTTTPVHSTPANKKRKRDMSSDVNGLLMESIQRDLNAPPPQPHKPAEKDPDTLFFLSLVQDFKSLSAGKKRIARVKIMEIISDMHGDADN